LKRIFVIALSLVFLAGCGTPETTEAPATEATTVFTTTEAPTVELTEAESPPELITKEQAKILADDLFKRGWQIFLIFANDLGGDYDNLSVRPNLPYGGYYLVGDNPHDVHTIAELKALTETAYTKEFAQKEFYRYDPASEYCGRYHEKDGALYFDPGGIGDPGSWYMDTVEILSQVNDTLVLAMDYNSGHDDEIRAVEWRLKWQGGAWKLDCSLWGKEARGL